MSSLKASAIVLASSLSLMIGCSPDTGRCTGSHCTGGNHDLGGNGDGGTGGPDFSVTGDLAGADFSYSMDGPPVVADPVTCADAAMNHTYIGCDYWPTVVANAVWSIFDYAVIVSNPGMNPATVTVTGPNSTNQTVTVPPDQLVKIYLPWVGDLKGGDANECGASSPLAGSVSHAAGAYHLVSTVPVLVYQFNALEYIGMGGPTGKDWSQCPGTVTKCQSNMNKTVGCYSFTNDASLLLPSTAMTGNYRVGSYHGLDGFAGFPPGCTGTGCLIPPTPGMTPYFAITATADNTSVTIKSTGQILAGGNVTAINAGGTETIMMNQGDVAMVVANGATANDLSGSQVQATNPVQVIGGVPCIDNPAGAIACDHIEETVMPAETLGKDYVVNQPTGPNGNAVGQEVRLIGNVDGTTLTFTPAVGGAPSTINAGQVIDLWIVSQDFEVKGSHEVIVQTGMQSADHVDPSTQPPNQKGDPSLSAAIATAQYRLKYVFLAPDDYPVNYADVVAPMGANLMLDGAAVTQTASAIAGTNWGVIRIPLQSGAAMGAHVITSDQPIGIQVVGYGSYTSYQYPAGLNLSLIAPPPPPIS